MLSSSILKKWLQISFAFPEHFVIVHFFSYLFAVTKRPFFYFKEKASLPILHYSLLLF